MAGELAISGRNSDKLDARIIAAGLQAFSEANTQMRPEPTSPSPRSWARERGTRTTFTALRETLLASGLKPSSIVPKIAAAKAAIRAAAKDLLPAKDAAAFSEALRGVKAPKKVRNAVGRSFLLMQIEERDTMASMTARDATLFRFLLATGTRISEALGLRVAHCRPDGRMMEGTVLGKGGRNAR